LLLLLLSCDRVNGVKHIYQTGVGSGGGGIGLSCIHTHANMALFILPRR